MTKLEKLNTKIQLLNMTQENAFVKRHHEIIHEEDCTPVLYSYINGCGVSVAKGIENIDRYVAKYFNEMSELKKKSIIDLLGKELDF